LHALDHVSARGTSQFERVLSVVGSLGLDDLGIRRQRGLKTTPFEDSGRATQWGWALLPRCGLLLTRDRLLRCDLLPIDAGLTDQDGEEEKPPRVPVGVKVLNP
jgi:hypothetical protein